MTAKHPLLIILALALAAILAAVLFGDCGGPPQEIGEHVSHSAFWVDKQGELPGHVVRIMTVRYDKGRLPLRQYSVVVSGHPTRSELYGLARKVVDRALAKGPAFEVWVFFYDYAQAVDLLGPSVGGARYGYPMDWDKGVEKTALPQEFTLEWYRSDWNKQPTEEEIVIYFDWLKRINAVHSASHAKKISRGIARKYDVSWEYLGWLIDNTGRWFNPPGVGYGIVYP